ncbi:hypothetical protein [Haloarcula marismortui]|uniref:Uncharacterized protein n=1 Tax=Haloarcula marismortui ATCC 33800 TaxID=662476 RepID=A0A8T8KK67_9EURY|nr:hypothetical protein [Haloarcula sinaiiensis]QUJ74869.1 hypothetical protein KDQ40_21590 [Haloarcula sinaiiensis ATCC 33800]
MDKPLSDDELRQHFESDDETAFELLIEGLSSHIVFMLNPEGNITTWPDPGQSLYGYEVMRYLERVSIRCLPTPKRWKRPSTPYWPMQPTVLLKRLC